MFSLGMCDDIGQEPPPTYLIGTSILYATGTGFLARRTESHAIVVTTLAHLLAHF